MIIDCHAHVSAPAQLWAYKATLLSHRGAHGRGRVDVSDEEIRRAVEHDHFPGAGLSHLAYIDKLGTDRQLLSPRPFQMMHSEKPGRLVQWFVEECNNVIHRETQLYPDRFVGIAGLPQVAGEPLDRAVRELERCVRELGFKGCLLNPDPFENSGEHPPGLGERYWYPLYEKLCELDVPAHIHGTGSRSEREPYTLRFVNEETTAVYGLVNSTVLDDFPELKIVVSHGGGAIPYQLGRFESGTLRRGADQRFSVRMRRLYYDTVLYTPEAIELLIKVAGVDQCLFGAECPGVGSAVNPDTGRRMDDVAHHLQSFEWLSAADKQKILAGNATRVFKLDVEG